MDRKGGEIWRTVLTCVLALSIPGLLVLNGLQSRRYAALLREVEQMEARQVELVEQNKKLITEISLLSSSERIEKIAEEELGMRPAETEEIVRLKMRGDSK